MPIEVPPIPAQSPPTPDAYTSTNGSASNARRASANRVLTLAYIMAVSMPPIGLGLGIVILMVRSSTLRSRHGVWIIAISILASIIWILIIVSGALNTTTTDY